MTERFVSGRTMRNPWVVVGLLLVPLLVAGAFLAGSWGQRADLGKVQAAIVNQDEMVTINGTPVPLGRQLAVALAERDDDNVTWNLTDASGAAKGLNSGQYAAMVIIPKNFSKAATSYGGDASQAEQATIQVTTSPSSGVADAALARQIAQLATQELSGMLTQTYLDNVYIGFNTSAEQFTTLSNGANQLATGAKGLSDGAKQASDGTIELNSGLRTMATGATQLKDGTPQLVDGATQLIGAKGQLDNGGSQLSQGGQQLDGGAQQLATGASQLSTGATELSTGVAAYTGGTAQVINGVGQLNVGIQQLNTSLQSAEGTAELEKQLAQLRAGSKGLSEGAAQLSTGATGLSQGLAQYQGALKQLATQNPPALSPTPGAAEVEQGCLAQGQPAELCAQFKAVYEQGFTGGSTYGWKAGLGAAEQGLTGAGDPTKSLLAGADQLATGSSELATGATQFDGGVEKLQTELPAALQAQQTQLAAGVQKLATGSQALATQSQPLIEGGDQLATGASQLATGASQLSSGTTQLATGVRQFSTGVSAYVAGVDEYSTGVNQFAEGASTYATGASQLADGVVQVADKTPELASGIGQLASGAKKLADGTDAFAKGIAEGATKVPSYSQAERERLSKVVAKPVQSPETSVVRTGIVPLTVLVLALGTWLGAMALHLIVRPVPRSVLGSSQPTWRLLTQSLLPQLGLATGWAALLAVVGAVAMRTSVGTGFGLFGLLEVAALSFVVINHALAAWLPGLGRLIALVWAAAAAAVGVTAALPGVFGVVHGFGPIKPALDGLRAVITGTSVVGSVAALIGWFLVALTFSAMAFARARQLTTKQYRELTTAA